MQKITFTVSGPFAIAGPGGEDLTPLSSQKAQALAALLITAPHFTRSRVWLREKLWSDRAPAQQSASLRQALAVMRRALGPAEALVRADRKNISLNPGAIALNEGSGLFLEGMEIRDFEFDAWLRIERGRRGRSEGLLAAIEDTSPGPAMAPRMLVFEKPEPGNPVEALVTDLFVDALARSLSEQFSVSISTPGNTQRSTPSRADKNQLIFSAYSTIQGGATALRVTLDSGTQRRRLWASNRVARGHEGLIALENDEIQCLVNQAIEGYADALLSGPNAQRNSLDAPILGRLAVRRIFTMRAEEFDAADDLLDRAFFLDPRGIYLAWKVFLRVIRMVERHGADPKTTVDEATELAARAMEFEPLNSMVLAAASNAAMLLRGDGAVAVELAQRAVRANQNNPFAWDCLSTAALHAGKVEEAHVFAVKSQRLAGDTPFKHWYDMGRALTATATGRISEAVHLAGAASAVPNFIPPLRYLVALHASSGQNKEAQSAIERLRKLEEGFKPEQMLEDNAYPVAGLRRSEILQKGMFSDYD